MSISQKIMDFIKKETVLVISAILAMISCFFVTPDAEYLTYVDRNTILTLFCLMAVMAGFQELGLFDLIGKSLLQKISSARALAFVLVFLCFFSSMFITNDVALITFVPLAILVLKLADMQDDLGSIIVFMTIAANLGSMLTPIGNPQNLYLYSISEMTLGNFLLLMLPLCICAAVLLCICILVKFRSTKIPFCLSETLPALNRKKLWYYLLLFLLCLLSVADVLSVNLLFFVILIAIFIENRKLLLQVDYSLLATFICFFIFIGNMGRFPAFYEFIMGILDGHEKAVGVGISQVISNVPASLLLSGFSDQWRELILGVNLGGLGTLIASMASLISYKQVALHDSSSKGRYLLIFTLWNMVFLGVLYPVSDLFM